jgi:hypothetical protein
MTLRRYFDIKVFAFQQKDLHLRTEFILFCSGGGQSTGIKKDMWEKMEQHHLNIKLSD